VKALVWNGPRQMAVESRDEPVPAEGEVLLRVNAVGICGSEVEGYIGESAIRKPPLIMGHECAAEVVAIAPDVGEPPIGTNVAFNPLLSCGRCASCRAGEQQQCPDRALIGAQRPGAFAEYVIVPADNVYVVPDGIADFVGALAEPLACCIHSIARSGATISDRVSVIGFGSLGVLLLQALRWSGIGEIVVIEPDATRRELAERLGASVAVPAERALEAGTGSDVAFDTVGKGATRALTIQLLRRGGTGVLLGLHDSGFSIDGNAFLRGELTVVSSYAYNRSAFARAVKALPRISAEGWITHQGLDDGPAAFRGLVESPTGAPKIILRP
jgi:2-desacetyl-2-hydroxyethyl bacteriochlorophyllide A dehydrogenase